MNFAMNHIGPVLVAAITFLLTAGCELSYIASDSTSSSPASSPAPSSEPEPGETTAAGGLDTLIKDFTLSLVDADSGPVIYLSWADLDGKAFAEITVKDSLGGTVLFESTTSDSFSFPKPSPGDYEAAIVFKETKTKKIIKSIVKTFSIGGGSDLRWVSTSEATAGSSKGSIKRLASGAMIHVMHFSSPTFNFGAYQYTNGGVNQNAAMIFEPSADGSATVVGLLSSENVTIKNVTGFGAGSVVALIQFAGTLSIKDSTTTLWTVVAAGATDVAAIKFNEQGTILNAAHFSSANAVTPSNAVATAAPELGIVLNLSADMNVYSLDNSLLASLTITGSAEVLFRLTSVLDVGHWRSWTGSGSLSSPYVWADAAGNLVWGGKVNWPSRQLKTEDGTVLAAMGDVGNSYQDIYLMSFAPDGSMNFFRKIQGAGDEYFDGQLGIVPGSNRIYMVFSRRTNNSTIRDQNNTVLASLPAQVTTNEPFFLLLEPDGTLVHYHWVSEGAKYSFGYLLGFDDENSAYFRFNYGGTATIHSNTASGVASITGQSSDPLNIRDYGILKIKSNGDVGYLASFGAAGGHGLALAKLAANGSLYVSGNISETVTFVDGEGTARTINTDMKSYVTSMDKHGTGQELLEFSETTSLAVRQLLPSSAGWSAYLELSGAGVVVKVGDTVLLDRAIETGIELARFTWNKDSSQLEMSLISGSANETYVTSMPGSVTSSERVWMASDSSEIALGETKIAIPNSQGLIQLKVP